MIVSLSQGRPSAFNSSWRRTIDKKTGMLIPTLFGLFQFFDKWFIIHTLKLKKRSTQKPGNNVKQVFACCNWIAVSDYLHLHFEARMPWSNHGRNAKFALIWNKNN
jgi:hypothetical protein